MKLKKLFAFEVAAIVLVLGVLLFFVEVSPYLISSKLSSSIGMYNQQEFAKNVATLAKGQSARAQFNYTSTDPAIVVLDLSFQSFQTPGDLKVYCNGRLVTTLHVSPSTPQVRLNVITVSGADWIKISTATPYTYGNEITFTSSSQTGYEGTFGYQIDIRGSR